MKNEITIIYASQTGQAKAIAESIFDLASEHDFKAKIYCISKYNKEFKLNELTEPVIFISSTTGDGETPETALKCWNQLKRLNSETNLNYLKSFNYALLGLGDTNYAQFANGPKLFHQKFKELGANCFFGPFYADDGTDLEIVVEPFKKDVWNALKNFINNSSASAFDNDLKQKVENLNMDYTLPVLSEKHLIVEFNSNEKVDSLFTINLFLNYHSINELFEAKVTENKILTSMDAIKTCHSLKFQLQQVHKSIDENEKNDLVKFEYEPGHSVNIIVPNDKIEVINLLKRLDCNSIYEKISIKSTNASKKSGLNLAELSLKNDLNMFTLFSYCLDIRSSSIKKALVRMLAEYCSNKAEKFKLYELCSKEGSNIFQTEFKENASTVLDILNLFPSCKPPFDYLIQLLSPLQPRAYSFCSAVNCSTKEMEIIFNLVKFEKENKRTYARTGIATGYLSNLEVNQSIYFFKRKIQNFIFPNLLISPTKPLILIGPGTGLAPFISFLRSTDLNCLTNVWLFYGCRDPNKDFLFKNELLNVYSKSLNHLSISFSRIDSDQIVNDIELSKYYIPNSKYVHDALRFYAKDLAKLIYEQDAYIYVCGDATNMFKDVLACLAECLSQTYEVKLEDAQKYFLEMMKNKRFKQDVWG